MSQEPERPDRIGPYRIVDRLGGGGMGTVYLAESEHGLRVALKVIRPGLTGDPEFRARFRQEAQAAQRVAAFCTARVLDADTEGDVAYIVTEYVPGPTLQDLVQAEGPLQGSALDTLAVAIALALEAVHGAGVIHRDLKPSNVVLGRAGPKVIDFGVARLADSMRTTHARFVGTPAYASPEQVRNEPLSPAVDVFAWGGVMVFAATGRPPFGSGMSALHRIRSEPPRLDGLDERLRPIVGHALTKDPRQRPSPRDLLNALGAGGASPQSAVQSIEQNWPSISLGSGRASLPEPTRVRSRVLLVGAGAMAAVAAIATAYAVVDWQRDDTSGIVAPAATTAPAPPASASTTPTTTPATSPARSRPAARPQAPPTTKPRPKPASTQIFSDDFTGTRNWPTGGQRDQHGRDHGRTGYSGGRYRMLPRPGFGLWRSAPIGEVGGNVRVVARGAVERGGGGIGVSCHGSGSTADDTRYTFFVNTSRKVTIVKDGPDFRWLEPGRDTPWASPYGENEIAAECRETSAGVRLTLIVNGRTAASVTDTVNPYPRGQVGITAFTWADQAPVDARFSRVQVFRIR